jgi:uncharacterized C2H2 Zn-finger protein
MHENLTPKLIRVYKLAANPPNPHLLPIVNDPNHYSRACDKILSSRCSYRRHVKSIHKMTFQILEIQHLILKRYLILMIQTFIIALVKNILYRKVPITPISDGVTI